MNLGKWLQVSFIVLKLCGIINWSWWVVLTPFFALILIGLLDNDDKSTYKNRK